MKSKLSYLLVILLFFGCSKDDENNNETDAPVAREIAAFFNSALPDNGENSQVFFTDIDSQKDTCYIVNSLQELQSLYSGDKEIPKIDFNKYTLILGKKILTAGYEIEKYSVEDTTEGIVVTLIIRQLEGTFITPLQPNYYWGLNNKLPSKKSIIKVIKQ